MRSTSLGAALALIVLGCGIDRDPTGPEGPGVTLPDPSGVPEPELATAPTNLWATKAPMPTPRAYLGVGVVNGVLYAVGGSNGNSTRLKTVQAYTPAGNSWTTKAALPSARASFAGIATINGLLYVAGGLDANGQLTKTLYGYNPAT